ncbi:MAG: NAD(P)H-dependent flavin oxidoreductase [Eubacteriaceae bacterium]
MMTADQKKIKSCSLGNRILEVPVIQGGMGVGISLGGLAGAVMREGGMGVISAADPGFDEPDYYTNALEANCRALAAQVRKARHLSCGHGLLGVNVMVACCHYEELVQAAVEAGADAIVSGAGLPMNLPAIPGTENVLLAPIVSSGKAARLLMQAWMRHHGRLPDFIVVEGPLAGGHLGFKREDLDSGNVQTLEEIVPDVLAETAKIEELTGQHIPVVAAGGIMNGADMARFLKIGAGAVQLGTRFIAASECDASDGFVNAILDATPEDIRLVKSPTGLPGRAVTTELIERAEEGRIPPVRCIRCIKKCNPATTPYCITEALVNAQRGNIAEGLVFCGARAGELHKRSSVHEIMTELTTECEENL